MLNFLLRQTVKILFGPGTVSQVGEILKSNNKKRVFLATDQGIVKAGIADKVISTLKRAGLDHVLFDRILPDAPAHFAEEGYSLLAKEKCDSVIAVGGGSTIDTTKAINMLRFNEGPILKYTAGPPAWATVKPSPGLIAIPTTAGTGSEMSDGVIISDENHKKQTILSPLVMPDYSILDAELLVGVPPHILASTGLDALSHLVEGYLVNLSNPLTDIICLAGAETVLKWLPVAFYNPKDLESRSNLMAASALGGWMLANVHCNSGHSFAHVLGSMFGLPHGFGCAYAMPPVTFFNAPTIPEKTKKIGELYGVNFSGQESPEEIGSKVSQAMIYFRDVTLKLKKAKEFPYDRARFNEAADLVLKEAFQMFNCREMSQAQALEILETIYS
ncbi:MAG: iron-containing alcohol dehydrogenase [Deltaproteobacteria bacterium]|jgi:alcohol dehydrogenase class IV|nr:iron-containing alcohol dehydrogenase [Deltaproteobacteria bacterium]